MGTINNTGLIVAESTDGQNGAIYVNGLNGPLHNSGGVYALATNGSALGITSYSAGPVFNSGLIAAQSDVGSAWAIRFFNSGIVHNGPGGQILAEGAWAIALTYDNGGGLLEMSGLPELANYGVIQAVSTVPGNYSVGVYLTHGEGPYFRIVNGGSIIAQYAIVQYDMNPVTPYDAHDEVLNLAGGLIDGIINLHLGDDRFYNLGTISGPVQLGGGRDIYYGLGGSQNGTVFGQDGNDLIIGTTGIDDLDGGNGADLLVAAGGDRLTGGSGADLFVFTDTQSGATIADFQSGIDRIDLRRLGPASVQLTPSGATTAIQVTAQGVSFTITATGTVLAGDLLLAGSGSPLTTAGDDALAAIQGGELLSGGEGNDTLLGNEGNDRLDGGAGIDLMMGGAGDDIYYLDLPEDIVNEFGGSGYDTMVVQYESRVYAMPDGVERLIGGNAQGNELDNVIIGSDDDNYLYGGAGSDQLYGGAGNDTYEVDQQSDLVFEASGEGVDTVIALTSYYLYDNIENLVLGGPSGSIFGVGNALDNRIDGNNFDNLIIAADGNDTVFAYAGNDLVYGGNGDDQIYGHGGVDYLIGDDGNDFLQGGHGADAIYGGAGNDELWGDIHDGGFGASVTPQASRDTDILIAGEGDDILHGDSLLADYDLMDGGAGNDIYWVDTGDDLTFEAVDGGIDTVHADVRVANAGVYLWANVENLVLEGTTAFGVGNELDNQLTGSASGNWLLGGLGADTINGAGGNDVLFGEGGADVFVFGANSGADVIGDFTRGTDRIQLNGMFSDFAALSANFAQVGSDGAIYLPGGNLIVLHGVTMSALTASDFIFAPVAEAPAMTDKTPAVMDQPDWTVEPLLADPAELGLQRWGDPLPGQTWSLV